MKTLLYLLLGCAWFTTPPVLATPLLDEGTQAVKVSVTGDAAQSKGGDC
jgi:hypothetical protein